MEDFFFFNQTKKNPLSKKVQGTLTRLHFTKKLQPLKSLTFIFRTKYNIKYVLKYQNVIEKEKVKKKMWIYFDKFGNK